MKKLFRKLFKRKAKQQAKEVAIVEQSTLFEHNGRVYEEVDPMKFDYYTDIFLIVESMEDFDTYKENNKNVPMNLLKAARNYTIINDVLCRDLTTLVRGLN